MKPEKPTSEPSMDEILASIRQIISSDPKKGEKHLKKQDTQEDILDLTEALPDESEERESSRDEKKEKLKSKHSALLSPKEDTSPAQQLPPLTPSFSQEKEDFHRNEPTSSAYATHTQKPTFEDPLVSQTAMSEAAQALHSLNKLAREKPKVPEPRLNEGIGGLTLEDLVRETLKPLLKEWLDTNLPTLVKWVVNEQVEKIVRQLGVTPHESPSEKPKPPSKTYDI